MAKLQYRLRNLHHCTFIQSKCYSPQFKREMNKKSRASHDMSAQRPGHRKTNSAGVMHRKTSLNDGQSVTELTQLDHFKEHQTISV